MVTPILRSSSAPYPSYESLQETTTSTSARVKFTTERINRPIKPTIAQSASKSFQKQVRFNFIPTVQEYLPSENDLPLRLTPLPSEQPSHYMRDSLASYKQDLCLQEDGPALGSTFEGIRGNPYLNQVALRRIESVECRIKQAIQLSNAPESVPEAIHLLRPLAETGYQKALYWMGKLQAKNSDFLGAVASYTKLLQLRSPKDPMRPVILHEFALLHKKDSIPLYVHYLKQSAEAGYAPSLLALGEYYNDIHQPQQSIDCYLKAARGGSWITLEPLLTAWQKGLISTKSFRKELLNFPSKNQPLSDRYIYTAHVLLNEIRASNRSFRMTSQRLLRSIPRFLHVHSSTLP